MERILDRGSTPLISTRTERKTRFIYVLSEKWLYYLFRRIQLFLLRKYKKCLTNTNKCFIINSIKCKWSDEDEKCEERKSNV